MRVANPPQMYPRVRNQGYRVDSWPEGGFPGSDFDLMREQLLDEHKVDYGILIPLHGHSFGAEAPEFAARAVPAPSTSGSARRCSTATSACYSTINIALESPELAVAEIERYAGDPRFVQVLLPTHGRVPARQPQVLADLRRGRRGAGCRSRSTSAATSGNTYGRRLALVLPRGSRRLRQRRSGRGR